MGDKHSRRDFIVRSGSLIAIGLAAPAWLAKLRYDALAAEAKGVTSAARGKVLVVVQLSGGNDGLNTVIPYSSGAYYDLRPELAIPEAQQLHLDSALAFHPSLDAAKKLYEAGGLAIVSGVGYPEPNRSHFASMNIWQTADPEGREGSGWLGRWLEARKAVDSAAMANPVLALSLGREASPAMIGESSGVPTFASLADVNALLGDEDAERTLQALQMDSGMMESRSAKHIGEATQTALDAMNYLSERVSLYTPKQSYGDNDFGNGFKQIAQLIAVSPATSVVYFSVGGFDTHAQQADKHAELLKQYGDGLAAFNAEMDSLGLGEQVCVMSFSEFGRRAEENGSLGTDHGAASVMLLAGGGVKGGLYGEYPSLTDLDRGDLKYNTDFREVYATVLRDWLGSDSAAILKSDYRGLPLFG